MKNNIITNYSFNDRHQDLVIRPIQLPPLHRIPYPPDEKLIKSTSVHYACPCVCQCYMENLIIYISCFQTSQTNEIQREDSDSSILEACGIIKKPVNVEKLVFGATLSKHHVASIEVTFLNFYFFIKFYFSLKSMTFSLLLIKF